MGDTYYAISLTIIKKSKTNKLSCKENETFAYLPGTSLFQLLYKAVRLLKDRNRNIIGSSNIKGIYMLNKYQGPMLTANSSQ